MTDPLRESGRGMGLVATLACDHGVVAGDGAGKTVWFEVLAWPGSPGYWRVRPT